jgi:glycosyltransferase involved in cell wall biosynthesis
VTTAEAKAESGAGGGAPPPALLIDLSTVYGGAQASLRDWAEAAPKQWRQKTVAIVACERLQKALTGLGFTVEAVSIRGGWRRSVPGVTRWLLDAYGVRKSVAPHLGKVEVVYLNGTTAASSWLFGGLGGLPTVLHLRDVRGSRWLTKWAAGRAAAVIAISDYQAGIMRGRWADERARKVEVIPNGVKSITPSKKTEARRRLNLPAEARVALIAADFVDWKRHERLLGALALSKGWYGLFAGGCRDDKGRKLRRDLESLAQRLRLETRVRFPGSVPMKDALGAADVLVSLADDEPFGRSVVEAAQVGMPVIAMERGGPAESLTDYDGAVLVEGEPPLISAAIREAAKRQPEAVDRWQPKACADRVLAILNRVAG